MTTQGQYKSTLLNLSKHLNSVKFERSSGKKPQANSISFVEWANTKSPIKAVNSSYSKGALQNYLKDKAIGSPSLRKERNCESISTMEKKEKDWVYGVTQEVESQNMLAGGGQAGREDGPVTEFGVQQQSLQNIYEQNDKFYSGLMDELDELIIVRKIAGTEDNEHERLLMEQNHYLREKLLEMNERINSFKDQVEDDLLACWSLSVHRNGFKNEMLRAQAAQRMIEDMEAASERKVLMESTLRLRSDQRREQMEREMEKSKRQLQECHLEMCRLLKIIEEEEEKMIEARGLLAKREAQIDGLSRESEFKDQQIEQLSQEQDAFRKKLLQSEELRADMERELRDVERCNLMLSEIAEKYDAPGTPESDQMDEDSIRLTFLEAENIKRAIQAKESYFEEQITQLKDSQESQRVKYGEIFDELTAKIKNLQKRDSPSSNGGLERQLQKVLQQLAEERQAHQEYRKTATLQNLKREGVLFGMPKSKDTRICDNIQKKLDSSRSFLKNRKRMSVGDEWSKASAQTPKSVRDACLED